MIYLWDLPDLITDLQNDTVPLWKIRLYYALSPLMSIINGLFFGVLLFGHHIVEYSFQEWVKKPHPSIDFYNYWGTSFAMLTVFTACFGIYLCYRANKKGDNKNFWTRMACLSFPINFNITMYALAILGTAGFIGYFFLQAKITAFQQELAGTSLIATPFIPGKINKFANNMRTLILMFYPVLALIPTVLSFIHYAVVRNLIKQVAQANTSLIDHQSFDPLD